MRWIMCPGGVREPFPENVLGHLYGPEEGKTSPHNNGGQMSDLSPELRGLIESGPMAHLTTINADGSPQVTVIWIGLDGDTVVSAYMSHKRLVQNIERDPRV